MLIMVFSNCFRLVSSGSKAAIHSTECFQNVSKVDIVSPTSAPASINLNLSMLEKMSKSSGKYWVV